MQSLLKKVNHQNEMRKVWCSHLKLKGEELLKEDILAKKSFRVIEDLLEFKKRQEEFLGRVFIDKQDYD